MKNNDFKDAIIRALGIFSIFVFLYLAYLVLYLLGVGC